jgi:molybdopterin molybdotransferase
MISVDEALDRILAPLSRMPSETISFEDAAGRVLAAPVRATRAQPPCDVSAMDGYALRAEDAAQVPCEFDVIGTSQAGQSFVGDVGNGQAVRIYTGAAVPASVDTIVLQEDTEDAGERRIRLLEAASSDAHIRRKGVDFDDGEIVIEAGKRLTPRDVALLASANATQIEVARRPTVAILPTGDELVEPGDEPRPEGIVSSTPYALAAYIKAWGGKAQILPIVRDNPADLTDAARKTESADFVVTLGGASVGDRDLVRSVLGDEGLEIEFWKVAIRPGKPLINGTLNGRPFLGLPGNPVSALVCAILFLRPALGVMCGQPRESLEPRLLAAEITVPLRANGKRQDYMRGTFAAGADGKLTATPFELQDSSVQSLLAAANCLIVRPPGQSALEAGDTVQIIPLD